MSKSFTANIKHSFEDSISVKNSILEKEIYKVLKVTNINDSDIY